MSQESKNIRLLPPLPGRRETIEAMKRVAAASRLSPVIGSGSAGVYAPGDAPEDWLSVWDLPPQRGDRGNSKVPSLPGDDVIAAIKRVAAASKK